MAVGIVHAFVLSRTLCTFFNGTEDIISIDPYVAGDKGHEWHGIV